MTEEQFRTLERDACRPAPPNATGFNAAARLPCGLTVAAVRLAMEAFAAFLGHINTVLHENDIERLESFMMPANFSSLVGEFMVSSIPKHCGSVVKNRYHNGHPDLIPTGRFPDNAIQYAHGGIEVKASRNRSGWQGHNPEESFLLVFVYDADRQGVEGAPKPFRFLSVVGAQLAREDWSFSGRTGESRRTPTASVIKSGHAKMMANWIYKSPTVSEAAADRVVAETLSGDTPVAE